MFKSEFTERFSELIQAAAQRPITHPKAGPLKQRLGAERFGSLISRCMDILIGHFAPDPLVETHNESDNDISLTRILDIAFAQDSFHTELIVRVFDYLSDSVKTGTLVDQLRNLTGEQLQPLSLEIAQIEGLLPALMGNNDAIPRINGIRAFSLKSSIRDQTIIIMGWFIARQMPENIENLANFFGNNETSLP